MATVFHTWLHDRFIETQQPQEKETSYNEPKLQFSWKHLQEDNLGDNVRAAIQFRGESQPEHHKRWFFLKIRPIQFHMNSASVIRPVKRNCTAYSILQIRFKFRSQFQLFPQIRCLITLLEQRVASSAQIAILQIASCGRPLMYYRKSVGPRMEP